MMNHQGNSNIQNKVNHQSTGALELLPTANSLTAGDQRFPDQVSGSNHVGYKESINIVPNNDYSAAVCPRESSDALRFSSLTSLTGNVIRFPDGLSGSSDLHCQASNSNNIIPIIGRSAGVGPQNVDSGNNLNMSLSLGLQVQEQDLDSSSVNMRHSCKRKSSEHTVRELLVGESSSTAAQTGISRRRASEVYGSNGLRRAPVSHEEQSDTIIGHDTIRPVSDMQHLNAARLSENFLSNIHHHTAANQQTFLPISILASSSTRNAHIQLPSQSPFYGQDNHPPFFRSAESSISPIPSMQPDEHAPNFHETSQAAPGIHMMRSSSGFSSFLSVYTAAESEAVAPLHYPRNIIESIMTGLQIGRRNWVHDARNSHFVTANFHGDVCPLHGFASDIIHSANAPTWFPGFNFAARYAPTPSRILNHPVLATTDFPRHSHSPADSDPSAVIQEMSFAVGFGNSVSQNQHTSGARSENQFTWSLANARNRMWLRPENLHTSEARLENEDDSHHDHLYHNFWSPANAEYRRRLSLELHHLLDQLHRVSGDPLRPMTIPRELRMLDHSVMMDMLRAHGIVDEAHFDLDNWTSELQDVADQAEPNNVSEMGLSEEMILGHLWKENFQPNADESEENECCCICQEDYQKNEGLGKLWCGHRFHVECIKAWLELKNICPICKQIALPIYL